MAKHKLTIKQRRFADAYIELGNAKEAAIKAGYSHQSAKSIGQENLTKPDLKRYIDNKLQEIASHKIMDAKEALELLTSIARGETKETIVVPSGEGVYESQKEADIKTRIVALKEILKRYPMKDDELAKAQLTKAKAEAKLAEYNANLVSDPDKVDDKVVVIDDVPDENKE